MNKSSIASAEALIIWLEAEGKEVILASDYTAEIWAAASKSERYKLQMTARAFFEQAKHLSACLEAARIIHEQGKQKVS